MKKFFFLSIIGVLFSSLVAIQGVSAQTLFSPNNLAPVGSPNFSYSNPTNIGRPTHSADSIDACLLRKEWNYNELYGIWVSGLTRCKINAEGVLSIANVNGISTDPNDVQRCVQKKEGQIIDQGVPSGDDARRWTERCSYLGALGGAGLPSSTSNTSSAFNQFFGTGSNGTTGGGVTGGANTQPLTTSEQNTRAFVLDTSNNVEDRKNAFLNSDRSRLFGDQESSLANQFGVSPASSSGFNPIYDGPGVQVPSADLAAKGIIKETSLINLIVFYTNATLPYVSVLSVLAIVAAGMFYVLSFTNEDLNGQAKNMIMYVAIGIIIIISSYTIVNTLLRFAGTV
ncbi:MAG: hypothetical protein P1V18_06245 [Candidatus Gracilibacteria bacterium]|nr:hypothetical protein [Candidatus Gracilibacteria bacterium]